MNIVKVTTKQQLDEAFNIRKIVFIDEQNVPPHLEMDEYDDEAIHFVGYDEKDEPIAASRLRFIDEWGKLERICVLKEHRGKNYGKALIEKMEDYLIQQGVKKAKLNAQSYAENFYEKLGYKTISKPFIDAGILHITMVKELS